MTLDKLKNIASERETSLVRQRQALLAAIEVIELQQEALEWTAHTGSIPQGMSRKHEAKSALARAEEILGKL